jgi:glycine oxidase
MEQPMRVLIVGGGVIGCSIAYFLRKRNVDVIVVEKGDIGAQASGAAAGLLAPIRPLSQEDPFKTLQLAGIARFPSFIPELEDASGLTIGYQQTGTLRILPPEKLVPARRWAEAWQKAGYRIDVLTPKEALAREPLLFPGLHGAVSIANEAQVVPAQLVKALAQAARRAGAFIYDHTEVIALERSESGESIKGAWTSGGELLRCDHLVIAAGTWSAKLGEWLSVPLPIRPVRGEIVALQQPSTPLRTIIFDEGVWDEDVYVAPRADGTAIIGATKAEVGFDTSVTAGGVQHLLDVAIRLLPALANCPITRMWACLRPKTRDSRPLLGPLPGWSNVTVASGHGGFGVTLSIITGETIAELVATGQYPAIIRPFAPQGQRSTRSNELSEEESAALPFYRPAFSEQQVKDFVIRWAIKQFAVAPANQARVRVASFHYFPLSGHWNCLIEFSPSLDDISVAIAVKDQALTVEGFVEYPPP